MSGMNGMEINILSLPEKSKEEKIKNHFSVNKNTTENSKLPNNLINNNNQPVYIQKECCKHKSFLISKNFSRKHFSPHTLKRRVTSVIDQQRVEPSVPK